MDRPLDTYGDAAVLGRIRERFGYAFQPPDPSLGWWRPALNPIAVEGPFRVGSLEFRPFEQRHGRLPSWGFRTGAFAYSPDVKELPEPALAELRGGRGLAGRLPARAAASDPRPSRADARMDRPRSSPGARS